MKSKTIWPQRVTVVKILEKCAEKLCRSFTTDSYQFKSIQINFVSYHERVKHIGILSAFWCTNDHIFTVMLFLHPFIKTSFYKLLELELCNIEQQIIYYDFCENKTWLNLSYSIASCRICLSQNICLFANNNSTEPRNVISWKKKLIISKSNLTITPYKNTHSCRLTIVIKEKRNTIFCLLLDVKKVDLSSASTKTS